MASGGLRVRIACALFAIVALLTVGLLAPGNAAPAQGDAAAGGVYVALGGSYTSGPLIPNQHGEPIDCGRSDHNYPSLVAEKFQPETFIDVSCGSAQTKDMTGPQEDLPAGGTNPPQFNALRADATLVTVGIGGNDAGLVEVGETCAQLAATDPNGTACRDHYAPDGNDTVTTKIEATAPKIAAILETIHERSPKARVAIVGYPDVLPDEGNCYPMVPLSSDDIRYIDELIIRINAMIAGQAAKHDADFVDTYADSGGHDVCKLPPDRWFEGLVPTEPAYPLHPNAKGEASMARSAIKVLSTPSKLAPELSALRVKPKRVRGDRRRVKVRFNLDRPADVTLTLPGATKASRSITSKTVSGKAGDNRFRLKLGKLAHHKGRYTVTATASADGLAGAPVSSRFRVLANQH